MITKAR